MLRSAMTMALVILASTQVRAGVPGFIPYSGRLTEGALAGASTTANLRVLLYTCACAPDAPLNGTACTEATRCTAATSSPWFDGFHPNIPIVDGYFSLTVGMYDATGAATPDPANSALASKLPLPDRLWITVSVDGAAELVPRQPVASVPYALQAGDAQSVNRIVQQDRILVLSAPIEVPVAADYATAVKLMDVDSYLGVHTLPVPPGATRYVRVAVTYTNTSTSSDCPDIECYELRARFLGNDASPYLLPTPMRLIGLWADGTYARRKLSDRVRYPAWKWSANGHLAFEVHKRNGTPKPLVLRSIELIIEDIVEP